MSHGVHGVKHGGHFSPTKEPLQGLRQILLALLLSNLPRRPTAARDPSTRSTRSRIPYNQTTVPLQSKVCKCKFMLLNH